ncbi:hypothetical protein L9F63_017910 [Diploptera punctata]|uniref:Uncharacterized protein n=1 Tax=Diploptera punctata TaxID=6984 RepID=A0AAD7ZXQ7_DIPPU|nr:hypothetical protein L9F63_017910 [Diploptera punctata]
MLQVVFKTLLILVVSSYITSQQNLCPRGCECIGPPFKTTIRCPFVNLGQVGRFLAPYDIEDFKCLPSYELGKNAGFDEHQDVLFRLMQYKHGADIILNGQNVSRIKITPSLDLWIDVDEQKTNQSPPQLQVTAPNS